MGTIKKNGPIFNWAFEFNITYSWLIEQMPETSVLFEPDVLQKVLELQKRSVDSDQHFREV